MNMPSVTAISGSAVTVDAVITLDETARHRRRMVMRSDPLADGSTIEFLLDLPEARLLRHGEALVLSDGRIVEVRAAPEALMEVSASSPRQLLALAWQIGNRHLPAEIAEKTIRLRQDHVIRSMLEGLGATVRDVSAAFDPEGGAYSGHASAHDYAHSHEHSHNHDHDSDNDNHHHHHHD